jgi:hypothetical protein
VKPDLMKLLYAEPPSVCKRYLAFIVQKGLSFSCMAKRKGLSEEALEFFRAQGKRGGLKSSKARMKKLTPEVRSAIAKKAAAARWGKKD